MIHHLIFQLILGPAVGTGSKFDPMARPDPTTVRNDDPETTLQLCTPPPLYRPLPVLLYHARYAEVTSTIRLGFVCDSAAVRLPHDNLRYDLCVGCCTAA